MQRSTEHEAFIRANWHGDACAEVGDEREEITPRVIAIWDDTPFGKMPRGTFTGSNRRAQGGRA